MRTASIDIGTNTIRLLICENSPQKQVEKVFIDRLITRLGEGFAENTRQISPIAANRSISALNNFSKIIKEYDVKKIRAVATSVVRESKNGQDFINEVANKTGIEVEVISGDEEARLTVLGVLNSITAKPDNCVIFDIGGGSTEYVHIWDNEIVNLTSTNLGVVHLTEQYLKNEIETEGEISTLSQLVAQHLNEQLKSFKTSGIKELSLIGTAGTPTTLAAIELGLKDYKPELVNNSTLSKKMVLSRIQELIQIPKKDRAKIVGLEKGREDILIAGAIILIETLKKFSCDELIVSDGGVLEGIAYSQI